METMRISTIKRFPQYLEVLYNLKKEGEENVSATKIAEITGVYMTQVRKDLAATGLVGTPKVGHSVASLIKAIEDVLNWKDASSCILVGAGLLGSAILGYKEIVNKGLKIVAAFDIDPGKIGQTINGTLVLPLEKLENLIRRLNIRIGIITSTKETAQEVADRMIANGIIAILNFTPANISTPEEIIVENLDMSASLAVLSRKLAERLDS